MNGMYAGFRGLLSSPPPLKFQGLHWHKALSAESEKRDLEPVGNRAARTLPYLIPETRNSPKRGQ